MIVDLRRILFPTDFSDPARHAQRYAMALAEKFGAELHILHVIAPMPIPFPDSTSVWTQPPMEMDAEIEAVKQRLGQELGLDWVLKHKVVQTACVGFAVEEIVSYSKHNDIDVVVIGTHGRVGLSHFLLGSVAEKLVRMSECPVLTVHPKGHEFLIDDAEPVQR